MTVEENGALRFQRCKCQSIRDAMGAMDRSGIPPDALAACTWENWKTPETWQRTALAMAQDYVQQIAAGDTSWFIICGTPGCGKTTLCTTIFRAIVEGGKPGLYVSWREFARRAKAVGNDRATEKNRINKIRSLLSDMKIASRLLKVGCEDEFIPLLDTPMDYTETRNYIAQKIQEADDFLTGDKS